MSLLLIYKFSTKLWAQFRSFNQEPRPLSQHLILFMAYVTFSGL